MKIQSDITIGTCTPVRWDDPEHCTYTVSGGGTHSAQPILTFWKLMVVFGLSGTLLVWAPNSPELR